MERTDKSSQMIAIALIVVALLGVTFVTGCLQATNQTAPASPGPTQQEQSPQQYDDGLDAALQELEETR